MSLTITSSFFSHNGTIGYTWVLYNIPPNISGLPEGVGAKNLPSGTMQGVNDWSRNDYGGPCPRVGSHRYFYKLYALNTILPDVKN